MDGHPSMAWEFVFRFCAALTLKHQAFSINGELKCNPIQIRQPNQSSVNQDSTSSYIFFIVILPHFPIWLCRRGTPDINETCFEVGRFGHVINTWGT